MKKQIFGFILLLSFLIACPMGAKAQKVYISIGDTNYIPRIDSCRYYALSNPEGINIWSKMEAFDKLLKAYKIISIDQPYPRFEPDIYLMIFEDKEKAQDFINKVNRNFSSDIFWDCDDSHYTLFSNNSRKIPDDSLYRKQQYLDYIHCPEAWALVDSVMVDKTPVGVVDINIDSTHPDYVILPKGVYYVTLNVEGAVADTQSLIVQ
ncbi:MAG: hypothetical protein MJZ96_08045 [Paludibacteraceae bacterium]|nr:hypothetical protein [Paludibacteraceae bacterium]